MPSRPVALAVAWRMAAIYLFGLTALLLLIARIAPHFAYTLDDPYIHLALAQNISHGTYGINAGEVTSPSSSVLWPFLLAPLSHLSIRYWVPLIYNLIFSLANCLLIGSAFGRRLDTAMRGSVARWCFAGLLVLSANMFCLTLTGMEHTLQVTAVLGCAVAILRAYNGGHVTWPLLFCAAVGPSIRYEDILFTLAVCGTLWLGKRRLAAAATLLLSLIPPVLLGLFLHLHGLSALPNSVISKGGIITARPHLFAHHIVLDHVLAIAAVNIIGSVTQPERLPVMFLMGMLTFLLYRARASQKTLLILPAFLACILMLVFGPYGWFYRYDVCLRIFLLIISLHMLLTSERKPERRLIWLTALAAASVYAVATVRTPFACQSIARQQYQMHRFLHDFAKTNVAINDLGLAAMDVDGKYYILDLVGLASSEALKTKIRDAAWASKITRAHEVHLVMIYPDVLKSVPAYWIPLGFLQNTPPVLPPVLQSYRVNFYATHPEDVTVLRRELTAFSRTLQPGTWFTQTGN